MSAISYVFVFLFGLMLGSFLNCVVYRLEKNKSFAKGRSFCPKCSHVLQWHDLVPVLSFVLLGGKCRYCGKPISWQYPLVEVSTGIILILNFKFLILNEFLILNFKFLITAVYLTFLAACLIVIFAYDLKTFFIPDKVVYPAIGLVLLYSFFKISNFDIWNLFGIWNLEFGIFRPFFVKILSGLAAASFFFSIWALSRGKWMGFGDVKLAFLIGLAVSWPNILLALFFSFLIGAIIGIGLIVFKQKKLKSEVPFGPFLVSGALIALFWGQAIINWYVGLL